MLISLWRIDGKNEMSPPSILVKDEGRLAELGYAQQLQRDWTFWHNFGVSFSIIVCSSQETSLPLLMSYRVS